MSFQPYCSYILYKNYFIYNIVTIYNILSFQAVSYPNHAQGVSSPVLTCHLHVDSPFSTWNRDRRHCFHKMRNRLSQDLNPRLRTRCRPRHLTLIKTILNGPSSSAWLQRWYLENFYDLRQTICDMGVCIIFIWSVTKLYF